MKTLCQKANVKYFRFHPLRHAGATLLEAINVPLVQIQDILGHENRKTTEMYIHSFGDEKRDVMRLFESARG